MRKRLLFLPLMLFVTSLVCVAQNRTQSKGAVTVELYNEDEMDGASEFYSTAIGLSENW